jgi:hypothetical protein
LHSGNVSARHRPEALQVRFTALRDFEFGDFEPGGLRTCGTSKG